MRIVRVYFYKTSRFLTKGIISIFCKCEEENKPLITVLQLLVLKSILMLLFALIELTICTIELNLIKTPTTILFEKLHFQVCIFQDQPWNPPDFMDEICQISIMKSAGFHEICLISPWIHWISWIVDFSSEPIQIYSITWSTTECCIFHQNQSPWHEIHQISWNLPNFMVKSANFMKSTKFHEIHQISCIKSTRFHEIHRDLMVYH